MISPRIAEWIVRAKSVVDLRNWFTLRDWLRDDGAIPPAPKFEPKLVAVIYRFDIRRRTKIEPMEPVVKRLRGSPDLADALALTAAVVCPEIQYGDGRPFLAGRSVPRMAILEPVERQERTSA